MTMHVVFRVTWDQFFKNLILNSKVRIAWNLWERQMVPFLKLSLKSKHLISVLSKLFSSKRNGINNLATPTESNNPSDNISCQSASLKTNRSITTFIACRSFHTRPKNNSSLLRPDFGSEKLYLCSLPSSLPIHIMKLLSRESFNENRLRCSNVRGNIFEKNGVNWDKVTHFPLFYLSFCRKVSHRTFS